jgi:DtxR family Mn-dependent transcriptional regulator
VAEGSAPSNELSRSREDFLADMYRLSGFEEPVRTGDMAQRLRVSPASANSMFKRLARDGLVTYREYAGASLTSAGERAALAVVRRHRVVERFLTDVLHFDWERVDELAHQMEHALPDAVVDALETLLGDPETCPHGHPIPSRDGHIAPESPLNLTSLEVGGSALIREVDEFDPALLHFLRTNGLVPGAQVRITQQNPVDGTVVVECEGRGIAVGPATARAVHVVRI